MVQTEERAPRARAHRGSAIAYTGTDSSPAYFAMHFCNAEAKLEASAVVMGTRRSCLMKPSGRDLLCQPSNESGTARSSGKPLARSRFCSGIRRSSQRTTLLLIGLMYELGAERAARRVLVVVRRHLEHARPSLREHRVRQAGLHRPEQRRNEFCAAAGEAGLRGGGRGSGVAAAPRTPW